MTDKLIRMAHQIADFFRSQPGPPPEEGVAGHINDFWGYRMRTELLAQIASGAAVDPIVARAAPLIRLPGEASGGLAPNDPLTHMNKAGAES